MLPTPKNIKNQPFKTHSSLSDPNLNTNEIEQGFLLPFLMDDKNSFSNSSKKKKDDYKTLTKFVFSMQRTQVSREGVRRNPFNHLIPLQELKTYAANHQQQSVTMKVHNQPKDFLIGGEIIERSASVPNIIPIEPMLPSFSPSFSSQSLDHFPKKSNSLPYKKSINRAKNFIGMTCPTPALENALGTQETIDCLKLLEGVKRQLNRQIKKTARANLIPCNTQRFLLEANSYCRNTASRAKMIDWTKTVTARYPPSPKYLSKLIEDFFVIAKNEAEKKSEASSQTTNLLEKQLMLLAGFYFFLDENIIQFREKENWLQSCSFSFS